MQSFWGPSPRFIGPKYYLYRAHPIVPVDRVTPIPAVPTADIVPAEDYLARHWMPGFLLRKQLVVRLFPNLRAFQVFLRLPWLTGLGLEITWNWFVSLILNGPISQFPDGSIAAQ